MRVRVELAVRDHCAYFHICFAPTIQMTERQSGSYSWRCWEILQLCHSDSSGGNSTHTVMFTQLHYGLIHPYWLIWKVQRQKEMEHIALVFDFRFLVVSCFAAPKNNSWSWKGNISSYSSLFE